MDYNDQDVSFVRDMIKHHQAGIDMALDQIDDGKNKAMITLAHAIISKQSDEITDMKKWLKDRDLKSGSDHAMKM